MKEFFRYYQWDGTQDIGPLDPDEILAGLTDDLMNFGDLQHALRNMMQRGMRSPNGGRMDGLRDLLQQLRQQRRQALDQFDLGSVFEDIQNQLEEILDLERDTLDQRLDDAQATLLPPSSILSHQIGRFPHRREPQPPSARAQAVAGSPPERRSGDPSPRKWSPEIRVRHECHANC